MKIISGARRSGKTIAAIKQAAASGAYLVVIDQQEAKRVADLAASMNLDIRFSVTFEELTNRRMVGSHVRNIVIDNADMLLQRMFYGLEIELATWTNANPKEPTT